MDHIFDNLKKYCENNLVDIVEAPLTLQELHNEIHDAFSRNKPDYAVILIRKDAHMVKYVSSLYINGDKLQV